MRLLAALFLFPFLTWAHGEEKPGPHGGHITMPGPFHVELSMDEDQSLHVFLLDIEFKNPTVKDSKISVIARDKNTKVSFNCSVMGDSHYNCVPSKKYSQKGELIVQATREKVVGNKAIYKLPLKEFSKDSNEENPHEGHH